MSTPAASGTRLVLFVAGDNPRSQALHAHLKDLLETLGHPRESVAMVDIFSPAATPVHDVFVTPTLLREAPGPVARMVGDLRQVEQEVLKRFIHGV